MDRGCLSLAESTTYVYDATDLVMGRLASTVAKQLLSSARAGEETRVIIVNAENAVVSGKKDSVIEEYLTRYRLNHARKGPFFPRMPALIVHGTQVAGVLSTAIYPLGFSVLRERSGGYDAPLMLCAGFSVVLAGAILCCFRKP